MKRLVILAIVALSAPVSAQPVTIGWRPPAGCSANDVIKWNGTAWTCGTVSTFSTSNVIPKGNGTGLASSLWTDNATTTAYNGLFQIDAATGAITSLAGGGFYVADDYFSYYPGGGPNGLDVDGTYGSVNSNAAVGTSLSSANLYLYDTTAMAAGVGGAVHFFFNDGTLTADAAAIKAYKENGTNGNQASALGFGTNDGISITERMRIRSDGGITFNGTTGTSGQVLTIEAGTLLPKWAAASGGSITGSGTANKVTKWTSSSAIGDGWASDDGTTWGVASKFTITELNGNFRSFGTGTVDSTFSAGADGFEVTSAGRIYGGDTANTSLGNNLDAVTLGNTGTSQTSSRNAIAITDSATYDTTGGAVTVTGINASVSADHTVAGSADLTNIAGKFTAAGISDKVYGVYATATAVGVGPGGAGDGTPVETSGAAPIPIAIYATASGGDVQSVSGYFDQGDFIVAGASFFYNAMSITGALGVTGTLAVTSTSDLRGNVSNSTGSFTIADNEVVTGTTDHQGAISNSTGTLALSDDLSLGASTSSSISFTNGPSGINKYEGKHFEWNDEWSVRNPVNTGQISVYTYAQAGGALTDGLCAGRPGCTQVTTTTSSSALNVVLSSINLIDFSILSTATFRWVGGFGTLSTSSERYQAVIGFQDVSGINPVDGCVFVYDEGNVITGGVNPSNLNKLEAMCVSNSSRTRVLLNGTSQDGAGAAGSITTCDAPVAAVTWPSTNVLDLKVVVTSNTSAAFYVGGSLCTTLTTNIPSGSTRATGAGFVFAKSVGTTARLMDVDFTHLSFDLTTGR